MLQPKYKISRAAFEAQLLCHCTAVKPQKESSKRGGYGQGEAGLLAPLSCLGKIIAALSKVVKVSIFHPPSSNVTYMLTWSQYILLMFSSIASSHSVLLKTMIKDIILQYIQLLFCACPYVSASSFNVKTEPLFVLPFVCVCLCLCEHESVRTLLRK